MNSGQKMFVSVPFQYISIVLFLRTPFSTKSSALARSVTKQAMGIRHNSMHEVASHDIGHWPRAIITHAQLTSLALKLVYSLTKVVH